MQLAIKVFGFFIGKTYVHNEATNCPLVIPVAISVIINVKDTLNNYGRLWIRAIAACIWQYTQCSIS